MNERKEISCKLIKKIEGIKKVNVNELILENNILRNEVMMLSSLISEVVPVFASITNQELKQNID